jgi:hypothetical protein
MPGANCYHVYSDTDDYVIGSALDLIWGFSHRHYCRDYIDITSSSVEFAIGSLVYYDPAASDSRYITEEMCSDGADNNHCCTGNDKEQGPCFAEFDSGTFEIIVKRGNRHDHMFGIKFESTFDTSLQADINDKIKEMYTY